MKIFLSLIVAALFMVGALVQASAQGKGAPPPQKPDPEAMQKAERKKAAEAEYQRALRIIPDSNDKPDPWKGVRSK